MTQAEYAELSSKYTYTSAAMIEGLEKIIKQNYSIGGQIPVRVLESARDLLAVVRKANANKLLTAKEVTKYLLVSDHMRHVDLKYVSRKELDKGADNLTALMDSLQMPGKVPSALRQYLSPMKAFFEKLQQTGESACYQKTVSGETPTRYAYPL